MRFLYETWNTLDAPSTTVTEYALPGGPNYGWGTGEASNTVTVPVMITLSGLRVKVNQAPGSGKSYVFTLRKNGADTAITVTIADLATSGSDLTHSVTFLPGDTMTWSSVPSGTPAGVTTYFSLIGDTPGSSTMPFFSFFSGIGSGTDNNFGLLQANGSSTVEDIQLVMPCSGTFHTLQQKLSAAPGSGKSYSFFLNVNGSDTALTATVADSSTTTTDTTHQIRVAAGDTIYIHKTASGAVAGTETINLSVLFTPDVAGSSPLLLHTFDTASTSATNWTIHGGLWTGSTPGWSTPESSYQARMPLQAGTITSMSVKLLVAPGSGKNYAFTLKKNNADTAATVTVADATTSGNITGLNIDVAAGDFLYYQSVPTGTPAATDILIGLNYRFSDKAGKGWGALL